MPRWIILVWNVTEASHKAKPPSSPSRARLKKQKTAGTPCGHLMLWSSFAIQSLETSCETRSLDPQNNPQTWKIPKLEGDASSPPTLPFRRRCWGPKVQHVSKTDHFPCLLPPLSLRAKGLQYPDGTDGAFYATSPTKSLSSIGNSSDGIPQSFWDSVQGVAGEMHSGVWDTHIMQCTICPDSNSREYFYRVFFLHSEVCVWDSIGAYCRALHTTVCSNATMKPFPMNYKFSAFF